MNTKLPEQIPYGGITDDFSNHLKDNYRIIFSGRFGSGKTEFLKLFFNENIDENETNSNYEVFHLYPVNYQVAANSDIFELIKYDILFRFLEKDWIEANEQFSHCLAMQSFIMSKGVGHLLNILKSIEYHRINKITELLDKLKTAYTDYQEYYKTLNSGDFNFIEDYSKNLENIQGGIYEFDAVSQLIVKTIENKKGEKKTVLIIDDLDRIDPEHIFRLLNVFSAHFDSTETRTNKFGFDKIIFVCDIENIRKIFYHKYGPDVDFNGYINKFYSRKIFEFDLSKEILEKLDSIISWLLAKISAKKDYHKSLSEDIRYLIKIFIQLKQCSLRDIEYFENILSTKGTHLTDKDFRSFKITNVYVILLSMFGSYERINRILDVCLDKKDNIEFDDELLVVFNRLTAECVYMLNEKNKISHKISYIIGQYSVVIDTSRGWNNISINSIRKEGQQPNILEPEKNTNIELTFLLLQKAFEEIEKFRSLA